MKASDFLSSTLNFYPNRDPRLRSFALWYFAILISLWMIAGLTILGFEQSYAHPIVGVGTAVCVQALLEWLSASVDGRRPRFLNGTREFLDFLPPCIIPGVACAMLVYPNERLWPVAFAAGLAVASKVLFRAPVGDGRTQHVFNPSNIGITTTLLLLPSVGLAPPYQFTENVTGILRWIIPAVVLLAGIFVHAKFTGRLPLVVAWLAGFAIQGILRSVAFNIPIIVPFVPTTSAAFILFTLFMIPDPATTPIRPWRQVLFGFSVAALYGLLFVVHVVFGLFIALASVCAARGIGLYFVNFRKDRVSPVFALSAQRVAATAAGD